MNSNLLSLLVIAAMITSAQNLMAAGPDMSKTDSVANEALVSMSEQKAIDALERILIKKQNTPEEPDLLERLSELYLKQAKSVRFFQLNKTGDKNMSLLPPVIKDKTALRPLKKAVEAFQKIQAKYPKYISADRVHFHKALTLAQMGLFKPSTQEIEALLSKFPKSEWRADGQLLIGEVLYDARSYSKALSHFKDAALSEKPKISMYAKYKEAWTYYNLERNEDAIETLKSLVKSVDPDKAEGFALRSESLRDLALFMTETRSSAEAFAFFRSFASEKETAVVILRMANIYRSHSKQKDARLLSDQYLKQGSDSIGKIQFHLLLAKDGKEQKNTNNQVANLQAAFDLCMIEPADTDACATDLRTQLSEAAEDAWKMWEKSKSAEHLQATKKILEIEIQRNPDPRLKTLQAYAELLYQSEDFENAARVYRDVSNKVKEPAEKEKAQYGSLVALDRWMEKDKNAILAKEYFKEEVAPFLKAYPKTPYRSELLLKWSNMQFEEQDFVKVEKNLKEILGSLSPTKETAKEKSKMEMLVPSQNLLLETLKKQNKDKEFLTFLVQLIEQTDSAARKSELRRLEAQLSLEKMENKIVAAGSTEDAAKLKEYLAFLKKYESDKTVTEPVFWKTLALALTMREDKVAFDLITPRAANLKDKDPRIWDSLKQILVRYETTPEAKRPNATLLFEASLLVSAQKERSQILWSYREHLILTNDKSAKFGMIEAEILKLGQEPESSLITLSRLEEDFAQGRMEKVFSQTRPLVGTSKPAVVRARARLLQARVLEAELISQRLKSSVDRMQMVVGMKLEKLSKAQEAFMSTLSLSTDQKVSTEARNGLKRCFQNSIESLKAFEIKETLTPQEKKSLDEQIQTLISPLEMQLKELIASDEVKS